MALMEKSNDFEVWLSEKLNELEIDSEVYGSYITGILEEEDETENKMEALEGILGSFMDDPVSMCKEMMERWKKPESENEFEKDKEKTMEEILAEHSAKKMNEKINADGDKANQPSETAAAKQALLAKYGEVFDEEDEDNPSQKTPGKSVVSSITTGLFKNVNVKSVAEAEKAKRDKQKEEAQKKKERDKMDREKQKLKKEERKEKEKKRTQKKEKSTR